jgi:hypothetical protein
MRQTKPLKTLLLALLTAFVVYAIVQIARDPRSRQWDFRSYYFAAQTDAAGGNPYDLIQLNRQASGFAIPPFVYPPPTLLFFRPFAALPYTTAYHLWLALKLLLAAVLILLWRRYLFADAAASLLFVYLVFAFGATFYIDLITGNITIVEQLFLWLGIILLLRGQLLGAVVAIVLSAAFKLTPVLFLLLVPLVARERGWRYFVLGAVVGIVALGTAYLIDPDAWQSFLAAVSRADEPGEMGNPSMLALCRDLIASIADKLGITTPAAIPYALYAALVALVMFLSGRALYAVKRLYHPDRDQIIIFLFCLAFALVMPRFKTYSFILILPAGFYALKESTRLPAVAFLMAVLALTAAAPFPISPYLQMFWRYYPLILTALVWGLLIHYTRSPTASAPA